VRSLIHHSRRRGSCSGFTLVETMIAMTIFAVVLGAVGLTVLSGEKNFRQGVSDAALDARASRLLSKVVAELQWAGADTLAVEPTAPAGASEVEFRVCTGFAGTSATWSGRTRVRLVPEPGETFNGLDDDGDGLTDEGQVELTRDLGTADEIDAVLGVGVARRLAGETANAADDNGNGLTDEAGLSFVMTDDTLTIRLTLEGLDPGGRLVQRTVQTAVTMRN
jgi:prepilin-type N-terminal cleavage/methylation domain-containing protein